MEDLALLDADVQVAYLQVGHGLLRVRLWLRSVASGCRVSRTRRRPSRAWLPRTLTALPAPARVAVRLRARDSVPATPISRSASVVSSSVRTIDDAHARPQQLGRADVARVGLARADDRAVGSLRDALDRGDRALQRLDDLGHRDLAAGAREHVAAARAAAAVDQPGLAQPRDEVLEVGQRQARRARRSRRAAPRAPRRRGSAPPVAPGRPSRARRTRPWLRTSSLEYLPWG